YKATEDSKAFYFDPEAKEAKKEKKDEEEEEKKNSSEEAIDYDSLERYAKAE
ncbi:MAG: hypothetical protein JRI72_17550, partial [Deltaproteobacteria bacterium]|nr:hypothetical protein [Deltaproteobacteria bacterium]